MLGVIHVTAASAALIVGLSVFLRRKGTDVHRWLGRAYLLLMLGLNGAALSISNDAGGGFGVFHWMALLSLVTIASGYGVVVLRRRIRRWRAFHAYAMAWSYVGLTAAAVGQAGTASIDNAAWPIALTLVIGGVLAMRVTPRALAGRRE